MDEKTILYLVIAVASMAFSALKKRRAKNSNPEEAQPNSPETPKWLQDLLQAGEQEIKKRVSRVDPKPANEALKNTSTTLHTPFVRKKVSDKAPTKKPHRARVTESKMKKVVAPVVGSTKKKRKMPLNLKQAIIYQTILERPEY